MLPQFQNVDADVRVLLWRVNIRDEDCKRQVEDVMRSDFAMDECLSCRSQTTHLLHSLFAFDADPHLSNLVPHALFDTQVDR